MSTRKIKLIIVMFYFVVFILTFCYFLRSNEVYFNEEYTAYVMYSADDICEASVSIKGMLETYSEFSIMIKDELFNDNNGGIFAGNIVIEWDGNIIEIDNEFFTSNKYVGDNRILEADGFGMLNNMYSVDIRFIIFEDTDGDYILNNINIETKGNTNNKYVDADVCFAPDIESARLSYVLDRIEYNNAKYDAISVIKCISVLFGIVLCGVITLFLVVYCSCMKRLSLIEGLMKEKEDYYKRLLKREEETKSFRHDYKGFLIRMKSVAKEGDINSFLNYIDEIEGIMNEQITDIYGSGNEIVDTYMNFYLAMLPKNIAVKVDGKIAKSIPLKDVELGIIMDNLFKNVAMLLRNSKAKGYVSVDFGSGKQYVSIVIKNNIPYDVQRKKHRIYSEGYGIANVKKIIKKNGGSIDIYDNREEYIVTVMIDTLNMEEEDNEDCSM